MRKLNYYDIQPSILIAPGSMTRKQLDFSLNKSATQVSLRDINAPITPKANTLRWKRAASNSNTKDLIHETTKKTEIMISPSMGHESHISPVPRKTVTFSFDKPLPSIEPSTTVTATVTNTFQRVEEGRRVSGKQIVKTGGVQIKRQSKPKQAGGLGERSRSLRAQPAWMRQKMAQDRARKLGRARSNSEGSDDDELHGN